jgi:O-Antigen ligase
MIVTRPARPRATADLHLVGLEEDRWSRLALGVVVLSLFLERFERVEGAGTYPLLPFPDMFFVFAIGAFCGFAAVQLMRGRLKPRPLGTKDFAVCAFVLILATCSGLAVLTQPTHIADGTQVTKTILHLAFLAGAALLLGRTLSTKLVALALRIFFVLAATAATLGVIQALDQNVFHTGLAGALHLISRSDARFARPASIFSEPAYLGYVSLAGLVIGIAFERGTSVLRLAGLTTCAFALLLSAAAGPLFVSVPLALYLAVVHRGVLSRQIAAAVIAGVVMLVLVSLITPIGSLVLDRARAIVTGNDPSAQLRRELNKGSFEIWKLAPLTGVGLGDTRLNLTRFVHIEYPNVPHPEFHFNSASVYSNLLGECGPVGVVAIIFLLIILHLRNRDSPMAPERATQAIVVLFALEFFVVGLLLLPPFWFWAGLRIALQGDQP